VKALAEAHISKNWRAFRRYAEKKLEGIETGIPLLDRYLLGLGGLVVFQGDTGANKSTLALQAAHHNMRKGAPCLMLDWENGEGRIRSRLVCQARGISETDLLTASIEKQRELVMPVMNLPMYLYTDGVQTLEQVVERVAEMDREHNTPPSMTLLVDSLQAATPIDGDQRVNLEKWMYGLDRLKVEYNGRLTILITSETKRDGYESGANAIGRGKGTNAIEFKAETLLDMRETEGGLVSVVVGKHRDGIKGARFELARELADESNPRSFIFKLKEAGAVDL
jgi:KaiC/GvpD/RAD55 family RecA-like ATPase